jgi:hypothetical protein
MAQAATKPEISEASIELLRELAIIPDCVGYDHRVRELDEHKPPLIEWLPRHGYTASHAGHEFLKAIDATAQSDDNLHPAFKATLDRFVQTAGRHAAPDPAILAANFSGAAVDFDVKAKNAGAEIIGHAHALFFHHKKMSAGQVAMELDSLRDRLRDLNGSFAQLELAHSAMTVGETASRIRAAAEPNKAAFVDLETELMRTMAEPNKESV